MTTAVIGGGLAGALTARALQRAGEEVVVVDAGSEPGGIALPVLTGGYVLEPAAGTVLLPHPYLSPLLEGLGLEPLPAPVAARRLVHHRGRTVAVTPGPGLVATPLLSGRAKLRLLAEPLVGAHSRPGESLGSFLSRRLGDEAGRLAAALVAAGVHAGDPEALEAAAVVPALVEAERGHGSLLRGLLAARRRAGTGVRPRAHVIAPATAEISRAVAALLGENWRRAWRVERVERRGSGWRLHGPETLDVGRVVAAVAPAHLSSLFPGLAGVVEGDEWAPVAVVWLGTAAPLPEAIGALVGPDAGFATLGFLFESSYAPHRAPAGRGLVKAIVGGARQPRAVDMAEGEMEARVRWELERVLGGGIDVEMAHVVRHRPGIPQYTVRRSRMLERLGASLPEGVEVAGWAYDGVGISALAAAAVRRALSRGTGNS